MQNWTAILALQESRHIHLYLLWPEMHPIAATRGHSGTDQSGCQTGGAQRWHGCWKRCQHGWESIAISEQWVCVSRWEYNGQTACRQFGNKKSKTSISSQHHYVPTNCEFVLEWIVIFSQQILCSCWATLSDDQQFGVSTGTGQRGVGRGGLSKLH